MPRITRHVTWQVQEPRSPSKTESPGSPGIQRTSNVEHGNASKRRAPDQTFASSHALDDDNGERYHAKRLCYPIEASAEEFGRSSTYS